MNPKLLEAQMRAQEAMRNPSVSGGGPNDYFAYQHQQFKNSNTYKASQNLPLVTAETLTSMYIRGQISDVGLAKALRGIGLSPDTAAKHVASVRKFIGGSITKPGTKDAAKDVANDQIKAQLDTALSSAKAASKPGLDAMDFITPGIGALYGSMRGIRNVNQMKRMAKERQYSEHLGGVGKASRVIDNTMRVSKITHGLPIAASMMAGAPLGSAFSAVNPSMMMYKGMATGAAGAANMMGMKGVGSAIAGAGTIGPMVALIGTQIALSMAKSARLSKITAQRKSSDKIIDEHSPGRNLTTYISQMAAQRQPGLNSVEYLKLQMMKIQIDYLSVLPAIYSEMEYVREEKEKQVEGSTSTLDKRLDGPGQQGIFSRGLDKFEYGISKTLAKYDIFGQLFNFIATGQTPKGMLDDLKLAYGGSKSFSKDEETNSALLGLTLGEYRLLTMKPSDLGRIGQSWEEKVIMYLQGIFGTTQITAKESTNARVHSGAASNLWISKSKPKTPGGFFHDMALQVPGLAALVHLGDAITGAGRKVKGAYHGVKNFLGFGMGHTDTEEFDKFKKQYERNDQEKFYMFAGNEWPNYVKKSNELLEHQLEFLEAIQEDISKLAGTGKVDRRQFYKDDRAWDFESGGFKNTDEKQQELDDIKSKFIESQYDKSMFGKLSKSVNIKEYGQLFGGLTGGVGGGALVGAGLALGGPVGGIIAALLAASGIIKGSELGGQAGDLLQGFAGKKKQKVLDKYRNNVSSNLEDQLGNFSMINNTPRGSLYDENTDFHRIQTSGISGGPDIQLLEQILDALYADTQSVAYWIKETKQNLERGPNPQSRNPTVAESTELTASGVQEVVTGINNVYDIFRNRSGQAAAKGGPVKTDRAYLVGEKGPEVIVPKTPGTVVPNDKVHSTIKELSETRQSQKEKEQEKTQQDIDANTKELPTISKNIAEILKRTPKIGTGKDGGILDFLFSGIGKIGELFSGITSKIGGALSSALGPTLGAMFGSAAGSAGLMAGIGGILIGGAVAGIYDLISGYKEDGISGALKKFFLGNDEGGLMSGLKGFGKYALMGWAIGSVVPGIGNIAGLLVGGAIGGLIGYFGANKIEDTYDQLKTWSLKNIVDIFPGEWGTKMAHGFNAIPVLGPLVGGTIGSLIDGIAWLFTDLPNWATIIKAKTEEWQDPIVDLFDGEYALKLSNAGAKNGIPFLSPLAGGLIGSIVDLFMSFDFSNMGARLRNWILDQIPDSLKWMVGGSEKSEIKSAGDKFDTAGYKDQIKSDRAQRVQTARQNIAANTFDKAGYMNTAFASDTLANANKMQQRQTKQNETDVGRASSAPQDVLLAIKQASDETGVPFEYLLSVATKESGLDPKAKAKTSSATGLFQFTEETWKGVVQKYGSKYNVKDGDILDPRAQAYMAAALTLDNSKAIGSMDPGKLYLAHFLGAEGAKKMLAAQGTGQLAADILPKAAGSNKEIFAGKNADQLVSWASDKMAGGSQLASAAMNNLSGNTANVAGIGGSALGGVNPDFLARFNAAQQEFGQQVKVTDGWRSLAVQQRLKQEKPNLAATPGTSMHGFGLAMDIDPKAADAMDKAGLFAKYGLYRPMKHEPWHIQPVGIDFAGIKQFQSAGESGTKPGTAYAQYLKPMNASSAVAQNTPTTAQQEMADNMSDSPEKVGDAFANLKSEVLQKAQEAAQRAAVYRNAMISDINTNMRNIPVDPQSSMNARVRFDPNTIIADTSNNKIQMGNLGQLMSSMASGMQGMMSSMTQVVAAGAAANKTGSSKQQSIKDSGAGSITDIVDKLFSANSNSFRNDSTNYAIHSLV